jgi:hypothetical protein
MAPGTLVRIKGLPVAKAGESDNLTLGEPVSRRMLGAQAGKVVSNAIDRW